MEFHTKITLYAASAVIALCCAGAVYTLLKCKSKFQEVADAFNYMNIKIVTNEETCNEVVSEIKRRSLYHAVGFDCEWVTVNGKRQAVALLQLSTHDGYCGLFRLNKMKNIPHSLRILLEDTTIYKVGVAPFDDAKYLWQDYSVAVKSSVDVRHLARLSGYSAGGLATLSRNVLHIILDKNWKIRCSDWEVEQLTDKQVIYAAADAHVAVKIFAKLLSILSYSEKIWSTKKNVNVHELCCKYTDLPFKAKPNQLQGHNEKKKEKLTLSKRYPHATRSKPLYHNCFLQAPDGELLCTCDNKKANWYVQKGLAKVVVEEPLTVRLHFEPAGRSVGYVGRYYQLPKENKCVVCGSTDSYIRKNVVPREYRKHFPEVMKDHSSHDVVLLCVRCHQLSNTLDLRLRSELAAKCDAPLSNQDKTKCSSGFKSKKIRSAARALLYQSQKHTLPEGRRQELENILQLYYSHCTELTHELLEEAAVLPDESVHMEEESHGKKVVEHFLKYDGLLCLEEYWRDHFLNSMEPKFMPELWSTKHNEERLRVKLDEGRLSEKDLQITGLSRSSYRENSKLKTI